MESVRDRHPFALQVLTSQRPEWVHGPYATLADVQDVSHLVFARRPPPAWPAPVAVPSVPGQACLLTLFTDGGCLHPAVPAARVASWSVVQDTAPAPVHRNRAMDLWAQHGFLPPALQVVAMGGVPGRQTAARAELCAALQAVRLARVSGCPACEIVTDSTYVLRVFREFSSGFALHGLLHSANLDLLLLMKEAWFDGVSARKVRAHCLSRLDRSAADLWNHLGNEQADRACSTALQQDLPLVVEMASEIAEYYEQQQDMLVAVYRYLVDLDTTVQRMMPSSSSQQFQEGDQPVSGLPFPTAVHEGWILKRRRRWAGAPLPPPPEAVHMKCTFGSLFSWRVWHWAQTLCWYESDGQPHTGTTTLELLCNYIVVTGSLPPVCVRHSSGQMVHVEAESVATPLIPVAYRHWLHILVCALKHLQKSLHMVLLPGLHRRKLQTLQPWGDRNPRAGTSSQVTFLEPEATASLLHRVLGHDHTQEMLRFVRLANVSRQPWRRCSSHQAS